MSCHPFYLSLFLLLTPSSTLRFFPQGSAYSLASSDRQRVHLWDVRCGPASIAELGCSGSFETAAEIIPGSSLVCAVNNQQQVGAVGRAGMEGGDGRNQSG